MIERGEQRLVQKLVPQPAIKALHECVLLRLAWCDVVPADACILRPTQDGDAGEFGPIVAYDLLWPADWPRAHLMELGDIYIVSLDPTAGHEQQAIARCW